MKPRTKKENSISGPQFFGLQDMRAWVEKFPGADRCRDGSGDEEEEEEEGEEGEGGEQEAEEAVGGE